MILGLGHVAETRSLPGASCDLRQRRLCLGQPKPHLHGMVQRDGSGQLLVGLLSPADLRIEDTEAAMGMSLEWAHPQLLGQGKGVAVGGFGWLSLRGSGVGVDSAKLVKRERLVSMLFGLPGQVERPARVLPGFLVASRQTTDLAEPCDSVGLTLQRIRADTFPVHLLQQRASLCEVSLERIGIAQGRRDRS